VEDLVTSYKKPGCNKSCKMHFLHSHLNSLLVNCGIVNKKRSERFHQDASVMENRYKGKWSAAMLAAYWMVKRGAPEIQYVNTVGTTIPFTWETTKFCVTLCSPIKMAITFTFKSSHMCYWYIL
jgi:hypothetical protein